MKVVSVISTRFNDLGQMMTKLLKSGRNDVQEVVTGSLPGIDSVPTKDMRALYETTDISGENFVVTFLVPKREAKEGEIKLFSTDANATEQVYLWLKNNGEIHFGGDAGNLTRYQELETAFNELKQDFNSLVNAFNTHMHATAATGPPSVPTPVPSVIPVTPSTADITGAKIDEFKTL